MARSSGNPHGRNAPRPVPVFAWVAAAALACAGMSLLAFRLLGWIGRLETGMVALLIALPVAPVVIGLVGRRWSRARRMAGLLGGDLQAVSEDLSGVDVLLIDDVPDHQRLIAEVLGRAGAEVDAAGNAAEGVATIRARNFDVVLIDLQMPEADGCAAVETVRGAGFTGSVAALTAHALAGDRRRCFEAGCDEYLTKPIEAGRLIRAVAALAAGPPAEPDSGAGVRAHRPLDPIRSDFADDPDLAAVLSPFVAGLPAQLDGMRDALANGDHEHLRRLAHQLKGAGGSYGYPLLTAVAGLLEQAARTGDIEAAQLALAELAALCQAVAAGHAAKAPADSADPPAT